MWYKWFKKHIEIRDERLIKITLQKNLSVIGSLHLEMKALSGRLSTLQKNIHLLDQKFDTLTDMLGIEIAADCIHDPPIAFVRSMSDKSLFASSKKYIEAAITAEKVLSVQYKMLTQQVQLMKDIRWR
jgi:hypothetical protein